MVRLAKLYKHSPLIRETARGLVQSCPDRDQVCEIDQLQQFVRDAIRYTADVHGVETLQTPVVTLGYRELAPPNPAAGQPGSWQPGGVPSGDCDDKSTLLAAMLLSIGIPGAFCAVRVQNDPEFSHVLTMARLRNRVSVQYVPLETIVPGAGVGWFPPDATCARFAHFS